MNNQIGKQDCYCRKCNAIKEHTLLQDMTPIGPTEITYECSVCKLRTLKSLMGYERMACSFCGAVQVNAINQAHTCTRCGTRNPAKILTPIDITTDPELALLTGIASLDEIPIRGEVS